MLHGFVCFVHDVRDIVWIACLCCLCLCELAWFVCLCVLFVIDCVMLFGSLVTWIGCACARGRLLCVCLCLIVFKLCGAAWCVVCAFVFVCVFGLCVCCVVCL